MRAARRPSVAVALATAALLAAPAVQPPAAATPHAPAGRDATASCSLHRSDTEAPVVAEVQLGVTAIDVSAGPVTVPVRARVTDAGGSGVASVFVEVGARDSTGRFSPGVENVHTRLAPAEGDWWAGSFTVGQWDGYDSPWAVHQVSAMDNAGNYGQRTWPDPGGDRTTAPSFTIAPHPADREQPYLEDLVLGRTVVDVRHHSAGIPVAARVSDTGGSGVASVTVGGSGLVRSSGTVQDGWWKGVLRVPRWTRNGYHGIQVVMRDGGHKGTWTHVAGLRARGLPWRYRARSVTDAVPPRLVASRVVPTSLDLSGSDGELTVAVKLTDAQSGVGSVRVWLAHARYYSHDFDTVLSRSEGTVRTGWWRGTIVLPQCATGSGTYRVMLDRRDRIGNLVEAPIGPPVRVVGPPLP